MTGLLIDTNVLVYAHDRSEPQKQRRAREAIARLADRPETFVSAQVLGETFRVLTRRLSAPLSVVRAERQLSIIARTWPVLPINQAIVAEAIRGVREHQLSYWDAQLWSTAALHQLEVVLTEDLQSASSLGGVRFENPFDPAYDLARLN
jgi:predicted nucleic acid-binding protein